MQARRAPSSSERKLFYPVRGFFQNEETGMMTAFRGGRYWLLYKRMYLMPLICTFKNGLSGKFLVICILPHKILKKNEGKIRTFSCVKKNDGQFITNRAVLPDVQRNMTIVETQILPEKLRKHWISWNIEVTLNTGFCLCFSASFLY